MRQLVGFYGAVRYTALFIGILLVLSLLPDPRAPPAEEMESRGQMV
jgi:hypothetical protein